MSRFLRSIYILCVVFMSGCGAPAATEPEATVTQAGQTLASQTASSTSRVVLAELFTGDW
jgi:hypothetical protein